MDAWIVYTNGNYIKKTENEEINKIPAYALKKYGFTVEFKNVVEFSLILDKGIQIYYEGKEITEFPRVVVMRCDNSFLVRQLEKIGVTVINSSLSVEYAKNKMYTYMLLANEGIRIPKTYYQSGSNKGINISYEKISKYLGEKKFIAKATYGAKGNFVYLIENDIDFNKYIIPGSAYLFQEFIETSSGKDIRAYIINGKYKWAVLRSNENSFKSNLHQGGSAHHIETDKKLQTIAEKSAQTLGLNFGVVDILLGKNNEYIVCELNSFPGLQAIKRSEGMYYYDLVLMAIEGALND